MTDKNHPSTACTLPDQKEMRQKTVHTLEVMRIAGNDIAVANDVVADEVPVALVYNGISHAVMLATPADLEDFALGFSLSEGIIEHKEELFSCEPVETAQGIELNIHLAGTRFFALKERRRALSGRTGCGLCGVDSLSAVVRVAKTVVAEKIHTSAIRRALTGARAQQHLYSATGAVHAAGWADLSGRILALREDVGRHNALDKLIGWHARSAHKEPGFIVVSSRASFEMVQKTVQVGAACLVAVSAPTAMAVRLAASSGLLLAGFARGERLVVYAHQQQLIAD